MTDFAALEAHILATPALLTLLESGANGVLTGQLDAVDTGFVPQAVNRKVVLQAIGPGLRALTGDALVRLRTLLDGEEFDARIAENRDELREIFIAAPAVLTRLTTALRRPKRLADRFNTTRVSLDDVREIARRVPSSYFNKYMRGEV